MNISEHDAKQLVSRYGVPVPAGQVADTADGARAAAMMLGGAVMVKADVAMTGRGAAGGVRRARDSDAAAAAASAMLGRPLAPAQRQGPAAPIVARVLVEAAAEVAHAYYVAVMIDPDTGGLMLVGSRDGGAGVETAANAGSTLVKTAIVSSAEDVLAGLAAAVDEFTAALDFTVPAGEVVRALCTAFVAADGQLLEVNPLAETVDHGLVALDVKLWLDANARDRQPLLAGSKDDGGLNFVGLDGDVAVVANGAGLALATNDMVVDAGGRPANFMDIRPSATSVEIAEGFDRLFDMPQVAAMLVNVHGGGMTPCDTVAEALGMAVRRRVRDDARLVPIVVRLAGHHAMFARTVLKNCGVEYADIADLGAAVRHVVAAR